MQKKSMELIEEKAKLSDKYDKDLKKFIVVCSFCGKYNQIKEIFKKGLENNCETYCNSNHPNIKIFGSQNFVNQK